MEPFEDPSSVVGLTVPADVRFLQVLRVSVATAALELEPTLERLDDLRLAIDELAASVIEAVAPDRRLQVRLALAPTGVRVRGSVEADGALPTLSEVGVMLLSSVCRDHRLEREGSAVVFEFTMDVGGRGAAQDTTR